MNLAFHEVLIPPSTPILEAIKIIDAGAMQIALVVDEAGRLLGSVTDGDVRRGILKGIAMDAMVEHIMNSNPTVASTRDSREHILALMKAKDIRQIPVVDEKRKVVRLELLERLIKPSPKDNCVVLMAGGLGSRLRPLTDDCPKPLLRVGNKPLLETILENCIDYGFRNFHLSVNYRADMLKDYFGDGSRWGVSINYLQEDQRMGTAGALSLLPQKPTAPILVMNGDLLTKVNFQQLLDFHIEHRAAATMCVREYEFQIPYGVVKADKHRLVAIEEKPTQRFFVSAGIYVLEPDVLDLIPPNSYLDMPILFEKLVESKRETIVFPIREYWLDIGQIDDFERANGDFREVFG